MSVTERLGGWLADRTSRRSFLARSTLTATALTVAPADLLLRPTTAYAAVCACTPNNSCACGSLCCDGYTQFCCTINDGVNACPQGSFPGGWWQASGSEYCAGLRYYIDCQGECSCACGGGSSFCTGCDGLVCECALGDCGNRVVGCNIFRYGQCNQQIACSGRISCRVVSCTPPYQLYSSCTTVSQTDNSTANHYAPCQGGPSTVTPAATVVGMAATPSGKGYWLAGSDGGVFAFGDAGFLGSAADLDLQKPIVGIAATPSGRGYYLVASDGGLFAYGDATFAGGEGGQPLTKPIVGMTVDKGTGGYWLVASDGGLFAFNAPFEGSEGGQPLAKPVVGMAPTATGKGYWLVASDGGIFSFGDSHFEGSEGGQRLNKPVVGMAPTASGAGYWLVASDGGIFAFGDATFYGSDGAITLAQPVVGMAATPTGKGYWLVAADGGIFAFGDAGFSGALPPTKP